MSPHPNQGLNDFQIACREQLDSTFSQHGVTPLYQSVPYDAGAPVRAADDPRYLHAQVSTPSRQLDAYVYSDEAGANVDKSWFLFEQRDHGGPERIRPIFIRFIDLCLAGESAPDAYRLAISRATG
jgi:hypothetical protein